MLFDHCATCQRCCHVDPGFPPLEVTLTREEKKGLGSVCIENSCEHLGDAGCTLGDPELDTKSSFFQFLTSRP